MLDIGALFIIIMFVLNFGVVKLGGMLNLTVVDSKNSVNFAINDDYSLLSEMLSSLYYA